MSRATIVLFALLTTPALTTAGQIQSSPAHAGWHPASAVELETALPARAPVERERIETEMSSASGIVDGRGRVIAAVVLITAGYAAQGKYSHFLLTQAPMRLGDAITLMPGSYVIGWVHASDGLMVHVYDAETGKERGTAMARIQRPALQVVPVKIWPPTDRSIFQIGRFALPYSLLN